jgi:hypothetical protein
MGENGAVLSEIEDGCTSGSGRVAVGGVAVAVAAVAAWQCGWQCGWVAMVVAVVLVLE